MISTSSHRYAEGTGNFTREALELMKEASTGQDPARLAELQHRWSAMCLKYGQDQTRAAMTFVEQCGVQALNMSSQIKSATQTPPGDGQD